MKNRFILTICAVIITLVSCTELQHLSETILTESSVPEGLSNEDVIAGLKQALEIGAEQAASLSSKADGFYKNDLIKIPFPEDAIKVKETAEQYGLGGQVEKFEMTLNRAAEEAAKQAAPIFVNAIKGMSVADGFAILKGGNEAATTYLKEKTTAQLRAQFGPKVATAIETVELTKFWAPLISKYNTVTLFSGGDQINPDLQDYITQKAIDGLFVHVAQEELKIRENPQARVTDLLQKVFGSVE
ncbi:MAG: hypothetical protein ACJAU0_000184 [Flavobacteriales bacterium]|jgi:hypothetical protein